MYISVDVGGTNIRVARAESIDSLPKLSDEDIIRSANQHDFQADMRFIIDSALRLSGESGISALGIATPGTITTDGRSLKSAKNMKSWAGFPLVDTLEHELETTVLYQNDGVAGGLGELFFGEHGDDFHYLIWGTGVGGGIVSTGDASGTKVNWKENFADWEKRCGGKALAERFGKPTTEITDVEWQQVQLDYVNFLKTYAEKWQPQKIVISGGLAILHKEKLEPLLQQVQVDVQVTRFGNNSGLIGGFGLIRQHRDSFSK